MHVTDLQKRKVLMEHEKSGEIGIAALKAGMNRKTAAKYIGAGTGPSEEIVARDWRTRINPFAEHWEEVERHLREAPELEGQALFEWLCEQYPGIYQPGQVRTFQRHLRRWRALYGPEKEVYFVQDHRPGVRLSTDFTCMNELQITIQGNRFDHELCHSVLSYSNWEWATLARSESFLALRHGVQATLLRLGHVPEEHWTDHSTAATHEARSQEEAGRAFNRSYLDLMAHFGLKPCTIQVGKPHENGDVESLNGVLKRRVEQHLLLRSSRDFASAEVYGRFLEQILDRVNHPRRPKLLEELARMRPLTAPLLPAHVEEPLRVSRYSVIHCEGHTYSAPSRLIGERVQVRRYEDRLEVYYGGARQVSMPRLIGLAAHAINYRHIIEWLVRKPGAFRQYRFREDLFPSPVFRRAYDQLRETLPDRTADLEYLRILRQAARTMESEVERVLVELEQLQVVPRWTAVLEFWPQPTFGTPELMPLTVQLESYDQLLQETAVTP